MSLKGIWGLWGSEGVCEALGGGGFSVGVRGLEGLGGGLWGSPGGVWGGQKGVRAGGAQ